MYSELSFLWFFNFIISNLLLIIFPLLIGDVNLTKFFDKNIASHPINAFLVIKNAKDGWDAVTEIYIKRKRYRYKGTYSN